MSNKLNTAKIVANSTFYSLVKLMPYIVSFFMLPIYSRYLSPEDYAIVSLVTSLQAIVATVVSLQLNTALPRFFFDFDKAKLKHYFSTLLISIVVVSLLFLIIFNFLGEQIVSFIYPKSDIPYSPYFQIMVLIILFNQISLLCERLLIVQERGKIVFIRSVFLLLIGLSAGVLLVIVLNLGALGMIISLLISSLMSMLFHLLLTRDYVRLVWKKGYFFDSLRYSAPLIPHAIGGYLFMYSDKLILEKFVALSELGLYAMADRISMGFKAIVNAINNSLNPNFNALASKDLGTAVGLFEKVVTIWSVLILTIYLLLYLFIADFVYLFFKVEYHYIAVLVPIISFGYLFRGLYTFSTMPIFFLKKTKSISIITVVSGLVNVVLNLILIPSYGVYAAAWTTVLSFLLSFIMAELVSSNNIRMSYNKRDLLIVTCLFVLIIALSELGNSMPLKWSIMYEIGLAFLFVFMSLKLISDFRIFAKTTIKKIKWKKLS